MEMLENLGVMDARLLTIIYTRAHGVYNGYNRTPASFSEIP
jgi:hypothetical protein